MGHRALSGDCQLPVMYQQLQPKCLVLGKLFSVGKPGRMLLWAAVASRRAGLCRFLRGSGRHASDLDYLLARDPFDVEL